MRLIVLLSSSCLQAKSQLRWLSWLTSSMEQLTSHDDPGLARTHMDCAVVNLELLEVLLNQEPNNFIRELSKMSRRV